MNDYREPFVLDFGIKGSEEVERDGVLGLMISGYASRFNEIDQDGEYQTPNAFADINESWGAEPEPIVIYHHGMTPELGNRRIGKAVEHRLDGEGLHVTSFIPKEPRFKDPRAVKKFREVYNGIKSGAIRGYSVGGTYLKAAGGALLQWSVSELSVTPTPSLQSATFSLGAKAITEAHDGTLPPAIDDLMPEVDGEADTADAMTPSLTERVAALEEAVGIGGKAAMKSEADGKHPKSHYLFTPDDAPSHWKLRVRNAAGDLDPRLLGAAHAALLSPGGYRGNKVQLPDDARAGIIAKLKRLYAQANIDWPDSDSPKKGGKTALEALLEDRPDLVDAALSVLREGGKVGRRHSAKDKQLVAGVIKTLNDHFLSEDTSDLDADQSGTANPDYPARNAVIA